MPETGSFFTPKRASEMKKSSSLPPPVDEDRAIDVASTPVMKADKLVVDSPTRTLSPISGNTVLTPNSTPPCSPRRPALSTLPNGASPSRPHPSMPARDLLLDQDEMGKAHKKLHGNPIRSHLTADLTSLSSSTTLSPPSTVRIMSFSFINSKESDTPSGNTTQVLEKLNQEIALVKLKLNSECTRRKEFEEQNAMANQKYEILYAECESLRSAQSVDRSLLNRAVARLDEMKTRLTAEKTRADNAMESEKQWRQALEDSQKENACLREHVVMLEARIEILSNNWKNERAAAQVEYEKMRGLIAGYREENIALAQRFQLLEAIRVQQNELIERNQGTHAAYKKTFEDFQDLTAQSLVQMRADADQRVADHEAAVTDAQDALRELKWALGLHNAREAAGGVGN